MGTRHDTSKADPQRRSPGREGNAAKPGASVSRLRHIQRAVGNQALQHLLRSRAPAAPKAEETEPEIVPDPEWEEGPVEATTSEGGVQEQFTLIEYTEAADEDLPIEVVSPEEEGFADGGRTATAPYGGGTLEDDHPHAFRSGGRTGTVVWGGGGGAGPRGNQPAGSVQRQVLPIYDSAPPPAPGGNATAWIRAGTGRVDVTRSWVGCNAGNQRNGYYVTGSAAERFSAHERQHVVSSQRLYNTHLQPLLNRVANHAPARPRTTGATAAAAVAALQAIILWPASVTAFQTADAAANQPMGTVDVADLASGTYPVDAGPGQVGGVNFLHRIRTPRERNPT